jgi:DNA-binding FadR family transcriptional regulator
VSWADIDWTRFDPEATDGERGGSALARSAADEVLERLVTGLALGLYLPGQKLPPERALAERLGVSRVTLREALARLEALGYVETHRGRYGGTVVTSDWSPESSALIRRALEPSWTRLEALFDLGRHLAPLIARLAAERRQPNDLARMTDAARRYADGEDRDEIRQSDRDFHAAIGKATHNPLLASARGQLRDQLTLGTQAYPYSAAIHTQASREHFELRDIIAARDGDAAADLALGHFVELVEKPLRRLYARSAPARRRRPARARSR